MAANTLARMVTVNTRSLGRTNAPELNFDNGSAALTAAVLLARKGSLRTNCAGFAPVASTSLARIVCAGSLVQPIPAARMAKTASAAAQSRMMARCGRNLRRVAFELTADELRDACGM